MKPITSFALLAAIAATIGAANAAATDPVGYITHTIAGASGSIPGTSFVSSTLVNPDSFTGVSTNAPSGGTTVTVAGALPAEVTGDGLYYVEIKSGANEGWWSTVTAVSGTGPTTVTVNDTFPAGLAVGAQISIRKHQTLKGLFGLNAAGMDPGLSLDDADEVQLLNPATQSASAYFFAVVADGAPVDGWYDGGGESADDVVIEPGASALVKRKVAGNLTFTSSGSVKVTKTQVDIFPGDNWVSTMRATGVELGDMNLDTGDTTTGVQQGSDLSVDEFQIIAGTSATAYFAADPVATGGFTGWFDGGGNPAGDILLPEGQGAVVKRKLAAPAIWTVPAVTVTP